MILCLDVGNTHIYGGVFEKDKIKFTFRYPSDQTCTSDVLGLFFVNVLRENELDPKMISAICIASVVPSLGYTITAACKKYFNVNPVVVKPGIKTGIKLDVKNPVEVGADRIANAVAAIHNFPNKNIIVLDFGTATTLCALTKLGAFIGGAILPGFKVSMEALASKASQLSAVNIVKVEKAVGRDTVSNIQSGLYFGQLGAVKEIISRINQEEFSDDPAVVLATGGYASMFVGHHIFQKNMPDLVLDGLRLILEKNG